MSSKCFSEQEFKALLIYKKKIGSIRVVQQQGGSDSGAIWMQRLNIVSITEDQDGIIVVVE